MMAGRTKGVNAVKSVEQAQYLIGLFMIALGCWVAFGPKMRWLGHLPGDFHVRVGNIDVLVPLATCVVISIILSMMFYLLFRE